MTNNDNKSKFISAYTGDEPYCFISYSHDEATRVLRVLRLLREAGIRFWYDDGIPGGFEWQDIIYDRLKNSSMFLCFLSNGIEQRKVALDEIQSAIQRRENDKEYKVLFIFLEKMAARVFSDCGYEKIENFINEVQHIHYSEVSEELVHSLFAKDVFPDALVRDEKIDFWRNRQERNLILSEEAAFTDNRYICETVFPERDDSLGFYKVRMEQVDSDAVCLACLDNQWCPPEFYDNPLFWESGFQAKDLVEKQAQYQKREICRSLLHNKQLIINRAFFYNSNVFEPLFDETAAEYDAFSSLLADGSMLVFLTKEKAPYLREQRPAFTTNHYDEWGKLCEKQELYCLRMDWDDDKTNQLKLEQMLINRFQEFCLSAVENRTLMHELSLTFRFNEQQTVDFMRTWTEVQMRVASRDRKEKGIYSREQFYRDFLIKQETAPSDCLLDINKPFAAEMKEIIDLQYGLNLADALGVRTIYPPAGNLSEFYRSTEQMRNYTRQISTSELIFAARNFWPDFLDSEVSLPGNQEITLSDVKRMRKMPEWKAYMRAVQNGRKRANLHEVDYYDISYVWDTYQKWLETVQKNAAEQDERNSLHKWIREDGAVSVIYRMGNEKLITVYHANDKRIMLRSTMLKGDKIPAEQDHTILLTISYVCADVITHQLEYMPLATEHRLFEGITKECYSKVWNTLIQTFESMPHIWQNDVGNIELRRHYASKRIDPAWREYVEQLQASAEERYQLNRYCLDKQNSLEWQDYQQLMQTRKDEFRQHEMLTIETDLRTICQYELKHPQENCKIGVRFNHYPYSLVVLDLVHDASGNTFPYERVIPAIPGGAVVCMTKWQGKYVLIEQFRHALREFQLAFPRGYATPEVSGEDNARKEISEEIGSEALKIRRLGEVVADSGLSGNHVEVFECEISQPVLKEKYEGIRKLVMLSGEELCSMIREGKITDGFTISALQMAGVINTPEPVM